ncbi:hypothetical protein D3C79_947480 [compost metagenome]
MEGKRLALGRIVEAELHFQRLVRRHPNLFGQPQWHVLFQLLGLELDVGRTSRVQ